MTDYLERLLDGQGPEDEEDGETLAWRGAALDGLAVRRTEDGADEGRGTELLHAVEGPALDAASGGGTARAAAGSGAEGSAPPVEEAMRHAADFLGMAEGAARPEDGLMTGIAPAAEGLYRALAGIGRVARMGRQTAAPSAGTEPPRPAGRERTAPAGTGGTGGGWTPEALDRVFQRDARRYDGGFTLY